MITIQSTQSLHNSNKIESTQITDIHFEDEENEIPPDFIPGVTGKFKCIKY